MPELLNRFKDIAEKEIKKIDILQALLSGALSLEILDSSEYGDLVDHIISEIPDNMLNMLVDIPAIKKAISTPEDGGYPKFRAVMDRLKEYQEGAFIIDFLKEVEPEVIRAEVDLNELISSVEDGDLIELKNIHGVKEVLEASDENGGHPVFIAVVNRLKEYKAGRDLECFLAEIDEDVVKKEIKNIIFRLSESRIDDLKTSLPSFEAALSIIRPNTIHELFYGIEEERRLGLRPALSVEEEKLFPVFKRAYC